MVQGLSYLRHICFFFLDVFEVLLRTCIELRLMVSKHTFSPVMPSGCFCHGNAPNVVGLFLSHGLFMDAHSKAVRSGTDYSHLQLEAIPYT